MIRQTSTSYRLGGPKARVLDSEILREGGLLPKKKRGQLSWTLLFLPHAPLRATSQSVARSQNIGSSLVAMVQTGQSQEGDYLLGPTARALPFGVRLLSPRCVRSSWS